MFYVPRRLRRLRHRILVCLPWLGVVSCVIEQAVDLEDETRNVCKGKAALGPLGSCVSRALWTISPSPSLNGK